MMLKRLGVALVVLVVLGAMLAGLMRPMPVAGQPGPNRA